MKRTKQEPEAWERKLSRLQLREGGFSKGLLERVQERVREEPAARGRSRRLVWIPAAALLGAAIFGAAGADQLKAVFTPLSKPKDPALQPIDPNTAFSLKVAYYSEEAFMSQYGASFQKKFPYAKLEIIPYGDVSPLSSVMRSNPSTWPAEELPDVVGVNGTEFATLAGQGKLYALDAVVKKDGFPLDIAHPGLIEALRKQGDGKLYGLAPSFNQLAIYYNKTLFDRYDLPYPKDGMTWQELLGIAAEIGERGGRREGVYGLASGSLSWPAHTVLQLGSAAGLSVIDPQTRKVALQTPQWRLAWTMVLDALRKGDLYEPLTMMNGASGSGKVQAASDPFLAGKAAMTLQPYSYQQTLGALKSSPDWDLATEPIRPDHPSESMTFSLGSVFAISANSPNRRAAWELIKFIQQTEPGRLQAERLTVSPSMPVNGVTGKNTEPLLRLQPSQTVFHAGKDYYSTYYDDVFKRFQTKSAEVLAGRKTLDQALRELQTEAEKLWESTGSDQPRLVPLPRANAPAHP